METLNLDSYVMAALSFHAIFMATYLFSAQNDRTDYLKLLGCTFIMLVAWYSSSFFEAVGAFNQYPQLISWPTLFIPLLAPSLYFYVQAISSPNKWDYRAQHKIHYYFAALIILIELPFTLAPGHIKVLQLYHMTVEPEGPAKILVTMAWISTALLLLQFACYIILAIRRLVNHATRIRHLFSNLENRTLIWLRNYLLLLCLLWGLGFSDFLDLPNQYGWLAHVIWVTTFSLLSLRQKPVFDAVEKTSLLTELAATDTAGKQGKTSLPIDRRSRIAEKLRRAMTADHLYRDADLTLRKLSDAVGVSTHHISETLRDEIGQNFYDYVNGCRVAEACTLLKETNDTTIDIAFTVGFNSRSTFSAAFKKHTDTSPAAFRQKSD